jgi:hypothetical protein
VKCSFAWIYLLNGFGGEVPVRDYHLEVFSLPFAEITLTFVNSTLNMLDSRCPSPVGLRQRRNRREILANLSRQRLL